MATNPRSAGSSPNSRVLKILKGLKASEAPDQPTADDYLAQAADQPGPDELPPADAATAPGAPGEQPGPEEPPLTPDEEAALPEAVRRSRAKAGALRMPPRR